MFTTDVPVWKFASGYYRLSESALETALSKVTAYREWRRLDPGPNYDVDIRYAGMPVFTKKDIRQNFPAGLLPACKDVGNGLADGAVEIVETSGTTGDKLSYFWDQKWWDASERSSWKLNTCISEVATGQHREAILVNPRNVGFISDSVDLSFEKRRLGRFLYLNEKTDPLLWSPALMDRMVEEINGYQPQVLESNPSLLARLCRYIATRGKAVHQPGIIVFTYEYTTHFHHEQIRRVFPVPTASSYGTTETGYVFMQCEKGNFHQNTDFCRVDFQPLNPEHGGPLLGRVLVTPFNNPWNYLVRFDTGDLAQLEKSGRCPCGRNSGIILSAISGHRGTLTLTCDGRLVTLRELDDTVCALAGVDEYQLIQTEADSYNLSLVSGRSDRQWLAGEASQVLKGLYGSEARVNVVYVKDIVPEKSGKYLISRTGFPIDLDSYLDTGRARAC